jgi:hypothetical protein
MANYSGGGAAVVLYADLPYSKINAESGKAQITVKVAAWYAPEERGARAAFEWKTLAQRASTLKQAKELVARVISQHPEFAPK